MSSCEEEPACADHTDRLGAKLGPLPIVASGIPCCRLWLSAAPPFPLEQPNRVLWNRLNDMANAGRQPATIAGK